MNKDHSQKFLAPSNEPSYYTAKQLITISNSSRQILRTAISNNIIVPKHDIVGKKDLMIFDDEDLLKLQVIVSLMHLGKKMVDSRSEHPETIVELFKRNNNDTYKIISSSKDAIIEEINTRVNALSFLDTAMNFDIVKAYNPNSKDTNFHNSITSSLFSNYLFKNLEYLIELLKNDHSFDENNYIEEFKYSFSNKIHKKELYKTLKVLLSILETDTSFTEQLSSLQSKNLKVILSRIVANLDNESLSDDYYDSFNEVLDKILPIIPDTDISEDILTTLTNDAARKIMEDSSKEAKYLGYYNGVAVLFSGLKLDGELALKLNSLGGEGTAQKIKSIAYAVVDSESDPYLKKLHVLQDKYKSNPQDPIAYLESISDIFTDFFVAYNKNLPKKSLLKLAQMLFDQLSDEFATVPSIPNGYWEYIQEKLRKKIDTLYT